MTSRIFLYLTMLSLLAACAADSDGEDPSLIKLPEKIYKGDVILKTQQEVDDFGENDYTHIEGWIQITISTSTDPITDLLKLSTIREIHTLSIDNQPQLTSLQGLNNVEKVGYLIIEFNDKLSSLNGLEKLKRVEGNPEGGITISWNEGLTSLDGLQNLEYVEGNMRIIEAGLTSLQELAKLHTVTNDFGLSTFKENSPVLDGLSGLTFVGGTLSIAENAHIKDLDELSNLKNVGGIQIIRNDSLSDFCGLQVAMINAQNAVPHVYYHIDLNAFNPTMEDIIEGRCSQ